MKYKLNKQKEHEEFCSFDHHHHHHRKTDIIIK